MLLFSPSTNPLSHLTSRVVLNKNTLHCIFCVLMLHNFVVFCLGKPVTTSVPSIAIRFHANAEEIEELYASDEEQTSANDVGNILTNAGTYLDFRYINKRNTR